MSSVNWTFAVVMPAMAVAWGLTLIAIDEFSLWRSRRREARERGE